jgi:hypothetical protein
MERPRLQAVAREACEGVAGFDPASLVNLLLALLPLLQLCAGPDPAGWLNGDGALFSRRWAARRRERLVRDRLAAHGVRGLVADRLVERLRMTPPLDATIAYREASL